MSRTTPVNVSGIETAAGRSPLPRSPDFTIGGQGVYVDQGPVWLVRFLFAPPWWFKAGLALLLVVVVAVAAWKIRREGIKRETKVEMATRAVRMGAVVGSTLLLAGIGPFPYTIDVVVGAGLGLGLAKLLRVREQVEEFVISRSPE